MNILYLTQTEIKINTKGIYADLINSLINVGHTVTIVSANAKHNYGVEEINGTKIVHVKIGEQYGVSFIKKGLVILSLERRIIKALKRYLLNDEFDLVVYATPPITLANVVKYCKKKYNCKSYLMLKDIFPQNAVDIGIMSTTGIMGIMYKLFRRMEINLYKQSDRIGCMNQTNIDYLLRHNPYIDKAKVEIFPNAVSEASPTEKDYNILSRLGIDSSKLTFIYGGNLGKPQGLDYLVKALRTTVECECNFVIIGSGQEKNWLYNAVKGINNVYTFDYLPHEEYIKLCASCDVGMLMLDYRFTIPNYPSRMLSYMENSMPIFACTDKAANIKELVENDANCGKWCYSDDIYSFKMQVMWFIDNRDKLSKLGLNGYEYLKANFVTDICVDRIEEFMSEEIH